MRQTHRVAASALAWPVALYIRRQRNRLSRTGRPLCPVELDALGRHFTSADLDRVRIARPDRLPLPGERLARLGRLFGWTFPKPAAVAAITFDHVVAAQAPLDAGLLFHEMVHVVQYRLLGGVGPFAETYVRGLLATGSYDDIPLERCAYDLGFRFEMEGKAFSVESEVAKHLERHRL